jgi:hypothetical protein
MTHQQCDDAVNMRADHGSSVESISTVFRDDHQLSSVEERPWLAQNETKAVWRLRGVVIGVHVIAAVAMGVATHWFATSTEKERFESKFSDDATRLEREIYYSTTQRVWVGFSLSVRILAEALRTSKSPIYSTLPGEFNLSDRSYNTSPLTNAFFRL